MTTPRDLEGLWQYTERRLRAGEAAHLDDHLVALGNGADAGTITDPAARWALSAWQNASPTERQRLAQLFIQAVGHEEFPSD